MPKKVFNPLSQAGDPVSYSSVCLFVRFIGWGFLGFLSPPFFLFASVLYVYISMYTYVHVNVHVHTCTCTMNMVKWKV